MGQRLVVQILNQGKVLANAYYHWSGFTESSAEITNLIVNEYKEIEDISNPLKRAVFLLYKTGARFAPLEIEEAKSEGINMEAFEFAMDGVEADRNNGLICISKHGMEESMKWAEAVVEIDMISGKINFDAYSSYLAKDFKEAAWEEDLDTTNLPVLDLESQITINNYDTFFQNLKDVLKNNYYAQSPDGELVYMFIA